MVAGVAVTEVIVGNAFTVKDEVAVTMAQPFAAAMVLVTV